MSKVLTDTELLEQGLVLGTRKEAMQYWQAYKRYGTSQTHPMDAVFDLFEKKIKELEHKFENGRQRYEANLMSMEDCSKMTTTQALKIKELETELSKYKEPYDSNKLVSDDVGNGVGYLEGHAWIGRVKANTTYEILVIEK
jgi:hypothetical protein